MRTTPARWKLNLLLVATIIFIGVVLIQNTNITGMVAQETADTLSSIDSLLASLSNGAYTPPPQQESRAIPRALPADRARLSEDPPAHSATPAADDEHLMRVEQMVTEDGVIETSRAQVTLGQRVKWLKNITFNSPDSLALELPTAANITAVRQRKDGIAQDVTAHARERLAAISAGSVEVIVDDNATQYAIEYETDAPQASEEQTSSGIRVQITAPDDLHYTDVASFTTLPESLGIRAANRLLVKWLENNTFIDFNASDTDGDGLIDYVQWVTPHLSNQTFDIIVVTAAQHLDANRTLVEDVYDLVQARDQNWTTAIPEGHFIRVTFERNLTFENDITLYAKSSDPGADIEVYEKDQDVLVASFGGISGDNLYKLLLTTLDSPQDTFDLKVVGGSIEFDYIVDPPTQEFFEDCASLTEWAITSDWASVSGRCDMNNAGGAEANMTSPKINLSGRTQVNLTFDITTAGLDAGEFFRVYLSNNNATFTNVFEQATNTFTSQTLQLEDLILLNDSVYLRGACKNNQNSEDCFWDNVTVTSFSTECGTINHNLSFANNINTSSDCIHVNANNIVINCRGFSLTGGMSGIGINATADSNITVRDCVLTNFTTGISFVNTTNSTLRNLTVLNSTRGVLINASPSTNNTLWGLTFINNSISLHVQDGFNVTINQTLLPNISIFENSTLGSINFTNTTNMTTQVNLSEIVRIQNTSIFVNVTQAPGLNRSAVLTFESIGSNTFVDPQPIVDLSDNNNYVVCTSGVGCSEIFTDLGTGVFIYNVSHFTTYKANETPQGASICQAVTTSLTLGNNVNTSGTCFQVVSDNVMLNCAGFSATGGLSGMGVNATNRANVTVRDCTFNNFSIGVQFANATNNTVRNTTLLNSTKGLLINASQATNNTLRGLSFINNTVSLHVQDGFNVTINETLFPNISIIENMTFGSINFTNTTNMTTQVNLSEIVRIQNTSIFVNVTQAPGLNRSAVLTFRSMGVNPFTDPQPIADFNDASTFTVCSAAQGCNEIFTSMAAGVFIYNVSRFTTYKANQTGVTTVTAVLNTTSPFNGSSDNLTLNLNSTDANLKNITVWVRNGVRQQVVNVPFEVSSGPFNATDYAGFDNNATNLIGGPVFNSTGGYDGRGAYQFGPAAGDQAVNLSAANFPTIGTGNLTIEARVKLNNSKAFNTVLGFNGFAPALYISLGDRLRFWDGAGIDSTTISIADGQWHHIAVVREGTGVGQLKFYFDGSPAGTGTSAGSFAAVTTMLIGSDGIAADVFNGSIDEVSVLNVAIPADQIAMRAANVTGIIPSSRLAPGDVWYANVTINNGGSEGVMVQSNSVTLQESCGVVNAARTLLAGASTLSTCFQINASNVVFNCGGFTIRDGLTGIGFNATGQSNVTIRDCVLTNFGTGILFLNQTNSTVFNVSFVNVTRGVVHNSSANNTLRRLSFANSTVSLQIENGFNVTINETLAANISLIDNTTIAAINFTGVVNLTVASRLIDIIGLGNNTIFINSTAAPGLNTSAILTLRSLGNLSDPQAIVDFNDSGIFQPCTTGLGCTNLSFDAVTGTFIFNVSHFTTYKSEQPTFLSWTFNQTTYNQGRSPPTNFTSPVPFNVRYGRSGDGRGITDATCVVTNNETTETATLNYDGGTGNYTGNATTFLLYDNTTFTVTCAKQGHANGTNTSTAIIAFRIYLWDFVNNTFGNESQVNTSRFLRKEYPLAVDAVAASSIISLSENSTALTHRNFFCGSSVSIHCSFLKSFVFLGNYTARLNVSINDTTHCAPRICASMFDERLNPLVKNCGQNYTGLAANTPGVINATINLNMTVENGWTIGNDVECVSTGAAGAASVNVTVFMNYSTMPISGEQFHAQPFQTIVDQPQSLTQLEPNYTIGPDQNVSSLRGFIVRINNTAATSVDHRLLKTLTLTPGAGDSIRPNRTVVLNSTGSLLASDNVSLSAPNVVSIDKSNNILIWLTETIPGLTMINETFNTTLLAALRDNETLLLNQTGVLIWRVNVTEIFVPLRRFENVTVFTNLTRQGVSVDFGLDVNVTNSSGTFNITAQASLNTTTGVLTFPQLAMLDDATQIYTITAVDRAGPNITALGCIPLAGNTSNVVTCNASITDVSGVSNVTVNVTRPDGTVIVLNMSNVSGSMFITNFSGALTGRYNVSWYANDSRSNIANKSDAFFLFDMSLSCVVNNATTIAGNATCINSTKVNTTIINSSNVACVLNGTTERNASCSDGDWSASVVTNSTSALCDITGATFNSSRCFAGEARNSSVLGCALNNTALSFSSCTNSSVNNSIITNSSSTAMNILNATIVNSSGSRGNTTGGSLFNTTNVLCNIVNSLENHTACRNSSIHNSTTFSSNASNSTIINSTLVSSILNNSNVVNVSFSNVTANNATVMNCVLANNASIDNRNVQNCTADITVTTLGCAPITTNVSALVKCNVSIAAPAGITNVTANVTRPDASVFVVNVTNASGVAFLFNATSSVSGRYNVSWLAALAGDGTAVASDVFFLFTQALNCTADANSIASGSVNCTNSIIANSSVASSNITACYLNGSSATNSVCVSSNATFSTLLSSFVDPSQLDNCNAPGSTILDSICFNSTKINSTLHNSTANLSFNNKTILINSTEQNSSMFNASVVNSTIQRSRVINTTVFNNSFTNRSFINNSRINGSNILNSTLNNATVINSNVTRCVLTNNATLVNVAIDCSPIATGKINRVLSGFLNFTNTSMKLPLGIDINTSASFLVMTVRENQSRPTDGHILGFIHNATHIGFERPDTAVGNVLVQWYVAEFREGVTVYRGISTVGTSENELAILIGGTVNTDQSFIIPAGFNNTGNGFNDKDYVISRVFNSTHIGASVKGVGGSGGQLSWQVVDFGGAFVQRGQVAFADSIVNVTLSSPVDRTRSLLIVTYLVGASSSSVGAIASRFTNDSGIEFSRNASSAQGNISWQVIELPPEQLILHNLTGFRPEEYVQNVTIPEVDLNRSIAFSTTSPFGGMSNGRQVGFAQAVVGHSMFTHNVTTSTNLELKRETNGTEAAVGWVVWVLGPINCGPVDHSINLNSNITVTNDTCFSIAANNIVINCRGFTLTGPGSGFGIEINNFDNVTIRDCIIRNFTRGIETELSAFTTIRNVTFITNGAGIFDSRSTSATFINNSFINNTVSLHMRNTLDASVERTIFQPIMLWENATAASINFTEPVNVTTPVQLSDIAALTHNDIFVSVVDAPEFNRSAVLSFRGITFADPQAIVDFNDTADFLTCNATLGCNEISFLGGTFIYNVSHFTTYSSNETPAFNISVFGAAPCSPCQLNVSQNMTCNLSIVNVQVFSNASANVTASNGSIFPQVVLGGGAPYFIFNRTDIGGIYNITWLANDTSGNIAIVRTNCTVQTAPVFANRFENPQSPAVYDAALEMDFSIDWLIFEQKDDVLLSLKGPTTVSNVSSRFNQFESVTPSGFLERFSQSFHGLLPGVYNGTWVANDTFGRKNSTNFTYIVRTPVYPPPMLLSTAGSEDGDDILSIDAVLTLPERVSAFNNATLSLYRMNGTAAIFLFNTSNYTLVQPNHIVFQFNQSNYAPGSYVAVAFIEINESAPNVLQTSASFIIPDRTSLEASGTLFLKNDSVFVDVLYFLGSTPSDDANCSISIMDERLNTVLANASMVLRNISAVPHYQFLETNWSNRTGVNNESGKYVGHVRCVRNSAPGTVTFTSVDFEVRDFAQSGFAPILSAIEGNATSVINAILGELNTTRQLLQDLLQKQDQLSAEEIFLVTDSLVQVDKITKAMESGALNPATAQAQMKIIQEAIAPLVSGRAVDTTFVASSKTKSSSNAWFFYLVMALSIALTTLLILHARTSALPPRSPPRTSQVWRGPVGRSVPSQPRRDAPPPQQFRPDSIPDLPPPAPVAQLKAFIRDARRKGWRRDAIVAMLRSRGWPEALIEHYYIEVIEER